MNQAAPSEEVIIQKLRMLPADRRAEVEDFIDFLRARAHDRELVTEFGMAAQSVLEAIWDNPEDAKYDAL